MKLSDLFEARFARQTYPDNKLIRMLKEPVRGNFQQDSKLLNALTYYFMDSNNDLRWRIKALERFDDAMGFDDEPKPYTADTLAQAVQHMKDNEGLDDLGLRPEPLL